jgi:hypothetical protein
MRRSGGLGYYPWHSDVNRSHISQGKRRQHAANNTNTQATAHRAWNFWNSGSGRGSNRVRQKRAREKVRLRAYRVFGTLKFSIDLRAKVRKKPRVHRKLGQVKRIAGEYVYHPVLSALPNLGGRMKRIALRLLLAAGIILTLNVAASHKSPAHASTPARQDLQAQCVAYVPTEWGEFKGGSTSMGLSFEDNEGTLRFVTNIPCIGTPPIALEIRRSNPPPKP